MTLTYFEGEHGSIALDRKRIIGASQCRLPTDYPTAIRLDCYPYEIKVRNNFDDVQARLMAGYPAADPWAADRGAQMNPATDGDPGRF